MDVTERGMGLALSAVRRLSRLELVERFGLRRTLERGLYQLTKGGARAAGAAGRTFSKAMDLSGAARQKPATSSNDLFDLTPTDEQKMLQEAFRSFAEDQIRPAALKADEACEVPTQLLEQSNQLGTLALSVPQELGGFVEERSTVTTVLAAEALAYGDLGIAVACLSPAAVATALALWGDADQQATYLTEFAGEEPPAAALAVLEPHAAFDPFDLATTARRDGSDIVLDGVKALVPRAANAELFVVAADLEGGPALVLIESDTDGLTLEPQPAMGVRAAATATVHLDAVRVPAGAVLADGDPAAYSEAIQRARLGWCAVSLGTAQAVLDYVIPYVNERHAFGEPISHRQSVAFAVSDIAIELEGMRLATYRAASRADQDRSFAREVAVARRLCADKGTAIGSDGVQLLGGHGYVKEHPVERWYRDLRAVGLMEGALLV